MYMIIVTILISFFITLIVGLVGYSLVSVGMSFITDGKKHLNVEEKVEKNNKILFPFNGERWWTIEDTVNHVFLYWVLGGLVISWLWPIALVALIIYLSLLGIRSVYRVKTKVDGLTEKTEA